MADYQNFRSALNGFNREDVVNYIQYLNNKHAAELNQVQNDMASMEAELAALRSEPKADPMLEEQLEASKAQCAQLEETLAQVRQELAVALQQSSKNEANMELETYRRAERTERIANERVSRLFDQVNGILADSTVKADEAAARIGELANLVLAQLSELQSAVTAGKNTMRDTASALYAVRPISIEE